MTTPFSCGHRARNAVPLIEILFDILLNEEISEEYCVCLELKPLTQEHKHVLICITGIESNS